jgi:hypothetical protein
MTKRTRVPADADVGSRGLPPDTSCLVVAESRETTDSLHDYLTKVGICTRTERTLDDAVLLSGQFKIILLFPDDFSQSELRGFEHAVCKQQPSALMVLVTSNPVRVRLTLQEAGRAAAPIILVKPAFGWTIIDTIRANLPR